MNETVRPSHEIYGYTPMDDQEEMFWGFMWWVLLFTISVSNTVLIKWIQMSKGHCALVDWLSTRVEDDIIGAGTNGANANSSKASASGATGASVLEDEAATDPAALEDRDTFQRWAARYGAIYVIGTGFRATFPRCTVERMCFFNTWLCWSIVGRTVATVAELAFVAQIALVLHHLSTRSQRTLAATADMPGAAAKPRASLRMCLKAMETWANIMFPMICCAECFSFTGVLRQSYFFFSIENSLWTIMGTGVFLTAVATMLSIMSVEAAEARAPSIDMSRAKDTIQRMLPVVTLYLLYMYLEDVPMYIKRWRRDQANGRPMLSLSTGLSTASSCVKSSMRYSDWRPNMVWMTLYFAICSWISIWLAAQPPAYIRPASKASGGKKAQRAAVGTAAAAKKAGVKAE
eukprot:g2708.t1